MAGSSEPKNVAEHYNLACALQTDGKLDQAVRQRRRSMSRFAAALVHDRPRLAALRQGLRARTEASPLLDRASYTSALEDAYRAA